MPKFLVGIGKGKERERERETSDETNRKLTPRFTKVVGEKVGKKAVFLSVKCQKSFERKMIKKLKVKGVLSDEQKEIKDARANKNIKKKLECLTLEKKERPKLN